MKQPIKEVVTIAGDTLRPGDEVTTLYHHQCVGQVFVIEEMNAYPCCASGVIVLVHLKGEPDRKLTGFKKEGYVQLKPEGIDANWFRKVNNFGTEVDSPPLNSTDMATKKIAPKKKTTVKAAPVKKEPAKKSGPKVAAFDSHKAKLIKDYPQLTEDDFYRYDGEDDQSVLSRVAEKLKVNYEDIAPH